MDKQVAGQAFAVVREAAPAKKADGVVVFSTDPKALVPTINKAVDKGIPVVTVFADVPQSKRLAYVGANQTESAKALANQVINDFPDRVKPSAKVLICFLPFFPPTVHKPLLISSI